MARGIGTGLYERSIVTAGRLRGKVALITGGARGQGAAEVELFAREGARVIFGDILDELGEALACDLKSQGLQVTYRRLDVTRKEDWDSAVSFAELEHGGVHVLVNNAGIVTFSSPAETSDKEWDRVIAVNQRGVFYGMRAAIPAMRRANGGAIINISSVFGLGAVPGYFAYQASKAAVIMMSRAAALDLAEHNIRVNTICPGLILTDMTKGEPPDVVEANIRETPLKRAGRPEEIAYGALYLASDESSFVTGTELVIDGGYLAH